jgi:hypothetical protein
VKPLLQRFDPSLSICVINYTHEYADAPHRLAQLRARRERWEGAFPSRPGAYRFAIFCRMTGSEPTSNRFNSALELR